MSQIKITGPDPADVIYVLDEPFAVAQHMVDSYAESYHATIRGWYLANDGAPLWLEHDETGDRVKWERVP